MSESVADEPIIPALDHPGSRVDSVYHSLLQEITSFQVRPGDPLTETKVAARLGVSRTPAREALQRLEKEGLVRRTDNARFTVSQITSREVNDACDMLEALDTYIFRRAAANLEPDQAEQLREIVQRLVASGQAEDREAWAVADVAFHRMLNEVAGNQLMANTVKETRRRIQRFWLRAASMEHRLAACSQEHQVLAGAIIDKDDAAIERAVIEHISHMRGSILDMLASAALLLGRG